MNYKELITRYNKELHTHSDASLLRCTVDYMNERNEIRNEDKTVRQLITEYLKYRYQIEG